MYRRALLAEEAGEVSKSLAIFEDAVKLDGEYTAEIQEILDNYYEVLGPEDFEKNWTFRLTGDVGFLGLHYEEYGNVAPVSENGGDVFTSIEGFVDLEFGKWVHSIGFAFVADWFISNKEMPVLDTNDWTLAPGFEYLLMNDNMILDLGIDFNMTSGSRMEPSFYGWMEWNIHRFEKQWIGAAGWAYYHEGGPLSLALYGSWHRTVSTGLGGSVYVGVKYEADSLTNYLRYVAQLEEWNREDAELAEKPYEYFMELCTREHGERCEDLKNGLLESYMYPKWNVRLEYAWNRWLGPTMRSDVTYKFKNNLSLEGKLNLFYGFVVDGPSGGYENVQKFSGTWGLLLNWSPNLMTFYFGCEQIYLHYALPKSLLGVYPENSFLTELKVGVRFEY